MAKKSLIDEDVLFLVFQLVELFKYSFKLQSEQIEVKKPKTVIFTPVPIDFDPAPKPTSDGTISQPIEPTSPVVTNLPIIPIPVRPVLPTVTPIETTPPLDETETRTLSTTLRRIT